MMGHNTTIYRPNVRAQLRRQRAFAQSAICVILMFSRLGQDVFDEEITKSFGSDTVCLTPPIGFRNSHCPNNKLARARS